MPEKLKPKEEKFIFPLPDNIPPMEKRYIILKNKINEIIEELNNRRTK